MWAAALPKSLLIDFEGHAVHVRHILDDPMPLPAEVGAVVYGHSHKPSIEDRAGVMYVNPGSAGPRRFRLPVTVARISVVESSLTAQIVELFVHP